MRTHSLSNLTALSPTVGSSRTVIVDISEGEGIVEDAQELQRIIDIKFGAKSGPTPGASGAVLFEKILVPQITCAVDPDGD